jgi:heme-degrading monooxygenase HmoA
MPCAYPKPGDYPKRGYWRDEESIKAWRAQADHARARAAGRAHWYESYEPHVARVERSYGFTR